MMARLRCDRYASCCGGAERKRSDGSLRQRAHKREEEAKAVASTGEGRTRTTWVNENEQIGARFFFVFNFYRKYEHLNLNDTERVD